jgi:hypothetical protein
MNNRQLIEAASLKTFHREHGLPPAEYVQQEMLTRGGGYEPTTLRELKAKVLAAQNVNGLALVILLRVLNKDDPTQQGFVTVAYDLTGKQLYHSGQDDSGKLPKSQKTGYREYGQVAQELADDTDLVVKAIERERQAAIDRANFLIDLLKTVPAVAANDDEPESQEVPVHAVQDHAEAVQEPDAGQAHAMSAGPTPSSRSRSQGSRRKS